MNGISKIKCNVNSTGRKMLMVQHKLGFGRHCSTSSSVKSLNINNVNEHLKKMEYAVRGAVPIRAGSISEEISNAKKTGQKNPYPFNNILYCNIGNPQAVGQKHISFYRNVSCLVDNPELLNNSPQSELEKIFGSSEVKRAQEIIQAIGNSGTGAYSDSSGLLFIRENVAKFIENRDGYSHDPRNIILGNGASSVIQMLFTAILGNANDSVMIPIPQYPLYSALIDLFGGNQAGYYLDEENGWCLSESELEKSYEKSIRAGHNPRAFVVINPGNPTGNVLSYDDIAMLVKFCYKHNLVLFADEVYQENIYDESKPFISCHKVVNDLKLPVEVASFHSTSKGFIGECGRRGGYMAVENFDPEVFELVIKLASSGLCSNLNGQVMTNLMVDGPRLSEGPALNQFIMERDEILNALKSKAKLVHQGFNDIPGVSCQPVQGAMYAFPKLDLSSKFIEKARRSGLHPDSLYSLSLLENTGICTVPGNGFVQKPETYHLRMTILPEQKALEEAMDRFKQHHLSL